MDSFRSWYDEDEHDTYNFPDEAMEAAWNEAVKQAVLRCREIAQQRFLGKDQAVSIDNAIAAQFKPYFDQPTTKDQS